MFDFSLRELVRSAQENSRFYSKLYQGLSLAVNELRELPIPQPDQLWQAHADCTARNGVIFKDAASTKNMRYSVYSKSEWNLMTRVFARGLSAGTLKRGDRLANLLDATHLSGDFLLLSEALHHSTIEVLHLPLTSSVREAELLENFGRFQVNIIAASSVTLARLMSYCQRMQATEKEIGCRLEQILVSGKSPDTRTLEALETTFPQAVVRSLGWVSSMIGLIGYSDQTCGLNEFRTFSEACWLELIDPRTSEPIQEIGRPGRILSTQLYRKWTPLIRYPTGDWAEWVDPPQVHDRKFKRLEGYDWGNRPRTHFLFRERSQSNSHYPRGAEQSAER